MIRPAAAPDARLLPPATGSLYLRRPRLEARLRSGLEGRATAVLAGPGYGKTALLSHFLRASGEDSAWYSIGPSDRDPSVFFRCLVQAVAAHAPGLGERSRGLWEDLRFRPEQVERLIDVFARDAEESLCGRLVLVLDGVEHLLDSGPSLRAVERLLHSPPGAIHLILAGRSLPDPAGMRPPADDAINRIDGNELLLTPDETGSLLRETFGLNARPEMVERIHVRTRGWVMALQLLRQTVRLEGRAPDLPEEVFARTEPEIFDYFSEEVFASERAGVREFLLGSCPTGVIEPEVCAEVLPGLDVPGLLPGLVRRHLFVSALDKDGAFYAFDPLFHDFLRRKLRAVREPEWIRALDQRYGRAFARRGDFGRALEHFLAAGSLKETADLLRLRGEELLKGGLSGAVREAARFLTERGARPPVAAALLGEACRLAGDHATAVVHFGVALGARGETAGEITGDARSAALQGLAYSLLSLGDLARAEETAARAVARASDGDAGLRARALNTLALVRYRQNRTAEALLLWQEALERARQASDEHLTLMIAHNLGLPHAVAGDFQRASECFRILTNPKNTRLGPEEGAAYLNLARIATLRGDRDGATSLLEDAREIAQKWRLQGLLADVLEEEGNLRRERGDLTGAEERYAGARALQTELGRPDLLDSLSEEEAILAARRGRYGEAETLAAEALKRRRAAGDPLGEAEALLALGEVRTRVHAAPRAARALAEAAAFFQSTGRAYQECAARLWLSLARHLERRRHLAVAQALRALEIAERHDYEALVSRVAVLDSGFRDLLASLAKKPDYLFGLPAGDLAAGASGTSAGIQDAGGPPAPDGGAADLTARLFGPIEVYRDAQRTIPSRSRSIRRALRAFCCLALAPGHRATRDRLAGVVGGGRCLRPAISTLRRVLNHGHGVPKHFIRCERGAYLLNPAYRFDIDLVSFEERLRTARRLASDHDTPGALEAYDAAIALYRGPLLQGEEAGWLEEPRAHYENLYHCALAEAGTLRLGGGVAGIVSAAAGETRRGPRRPRHAAGR